MERDGANDETKKNIIYECVCLMRKREWFYGCMSLVHKLRLYWKGDKQHRKKEKTPPSKKALKYFIFYIRAFNSIFWWFLDRNINLKCWKLIQEISLC